MAKFELISKYSDATLLPERKTKDSAGYDFIVAEDTLIPPYDFLLNEIYYKVAEPETGDVEPMTLSEVAALTKELNAKPTLVPTGIKAELDEGTYLELSVRSSCPLKHWLLLANGVGIIDRDYYNNPDNEGHIYFQIINLSPIPIILKKGDRIGQGIIKTYLTTKEDAAAGERTGGLGSTGN